MSLSFSLSAVLLILFSAASTINLHGRFLILYYLYSPPFLIIIFNARVRIDVLFFSVEIE
jgi:hypothetical protein